MHSGSDQSKSSWQKSFLIHISLPRPVPVLRALQQRRAHIPAGTLWDFVILHRELHLFLCTVSLQCASEEQTFTDVTLPFTQTKQAAKDGEQHEFVETLELSLQFISVDRQQPWTTSRLNQEYTQTNVTSVIKAEECPKVCPTSFPLQSNPLVCLQKLP